MKKLIATLLVSVFCLSLYSCGKSTEVVAFENLVKEIGTVSLDDEVAISAAELSYSLLSDEDKEDASKYHDVLLEKRAKYDELVVEAQLKAEQEKRLNSVINLIDAIGTVTLNSNAKITVAENAYNKLSDEEKEMISEQGAQLQVCRDTYTALVEEKMAANAQTVSDAIDAIGEVTTNSKAIIETARKKYNALTAEEKNLVYNYILLESAEETYMILRAEVVIDAIDKIGTVTTDSKDSIQAAQKLYNALTSEEKEYVSNYDDLKNAEKAFAAVRSKAVIDAIDNIGTVTINSKETITTARELYDALDANEKSLVTNYKTLCDAEELYASTEKQYDIEKHVKNFNRKDDAVNGSTLYTHKNSIISNKKTYITPVILISDNKAYLGVYYCYSGDMILWKNLTISIDGKVYNKNVDYFDINRDYEIGYTTEKYSEIINGDLEEIEMLASIGTSTQTIIRFSGSSGTYDHYVTATEKQVIVDTLLLYLTLIQ